MDVTAGHVDDGEEGEPATAAVSADLGVHRLRDLSSRDRLLALALALALLVAPLTSAIRMWGTWTPTSDNALIELRVRDVGSSRTPLIGQPSTSGNYGKSRQNAAHPGPIEFYLLAPGVRALGGPVGMLLTTALITGVSVLVAAWAVFRQLGRGAGLAASVVLAAVMWASGAAAMVNPISSSIGRFPLLCSVVLLWCLLCGDVRLLALTCAFVSFTLQQHLSVVPVTLVVTAVGFAGLLVTLVRNGALRDPERRREATRSGLIAGIVTLVLWSPVIYEQITSSTGNLTRILRYAGDDTRGSVGNASALRQLAHALGLPPLLGRINLTGYNLVARVPVYTAITAAVAVALLIFAWIHWRREKPRLGALVLMTGALAVGGFINGTNVPASLEQGRIAFYHWAFILAFLEVLILVLAVAPPLWRWARTQELWQRPAVTALAAPVVLVLVLAPAIGNLVIPRTDNKLPYTIPRSAIDAAVSKIRAQRGQFDEPTLLLSRGERTFTGLREAVAARLDAEGIDVLNPAILAGAVHKDRLVGHRQPRSAIVVATNVGGPPKGIPGRLIGTADPSPGFDRQAFALLVRQAQAAPRLVLGDAFERKLRAETPRLLALHGRSKGTRKFVAERMRSIESTLSRLTTQPADVLSHEWVLRLLASTPLAQPVLDHDALESVLRTFPKACAGCPKDDFIIDVTLIAHRPLGLRP